MKRRTYKSIASEKKTSTLQEWYFTCNILHFMNMFSYSTVSAHRADTAPVGRTVRCWNSQALMMLVASFGNMPRFFCCLCPFVSESSSAVPSPDPILLSRPSPEDANNQETLTTLSRDILHRATLHSFNFRTGNIARNAIHSGCYSDKILKQNETRQ